MERLLRVYHARKKIFEYQSEQIHSFIGESATSQANLLPAIDQCLNDLTFLNKQVETLNSACHQRLELFSPCLSKDRIATIQEEENPPVFNTDFSTEQKEMSIKSVTMAGDLCKSMMSSSHQRSLEETFKFHESIVELSEKTTSLNKIIKELHAATLKLKETKEKVENEKRTEFQELKKNKKTKKQAEETEVVVGISYRLVYQLSLILDSFDHSLSILQTLLKFLKKEIAPLFPQEKPADSDGLAPLFKKRKRPRKTVDLTLPSLPPALEMTPQKPIAPSSTPVILEKHTLNNLFSRHQKYLLSISAAHAFTERSPHFRQTQFHHRILQSTATLLKQTLKTGKEQFLPYLTFATIRSCSLISEQALTANLKVAVISHDHIDLASQLNLQDGQLHSYLESIRHGVIFHRYPYTSNLYLKEHGIASPKTLQLLQHSTVRSSDLIDLMSNTTQALEQILADFPANSASELKEKLCSYSKQSGEIPSHPFSSYFQEALEIPILSLERTLAKTEKLASSFEENSIKIAITQDIHISLKFLKQALECLTLFPQTATLLGLGDSILTLLQFTDEHIEKLCHLQSFGQLRMIHNLEAYRDSRDYQEKPQIQEIISQLNIGYGAQYPYQYKQDTGRSPGGITWRLKALELAMNSQQTDKTALEEKQNREKGFNLVKKKTKQTPSQQQPLFELHDQLVKFIQGMTETFETRLNILPKGHDLELKNHS